MVKFCHLCEKEFEGSFESHSLTDEHGVAEDSVYSGSDKGSKHSLYCYKCEFSGRTDKEWNAHIKTEKHKNIDKPKENHHCEKCDFKARNPTEWRIHLATKKHNSDGIKENFHCEKCGITATCRKQWDAHLATKKHIGREETNYHCEKCNYRTTIPHLIKQHEATKKHQRG